MRHVPMKSNWSERTTLYFTVLKPFCKYRIATRVFGATKLGGVALTGPHLEIEHYNVSEISCTRVGQCTETGWYTWMANNHSIPISGYELHALCVNETIEEIAREQ